MSKNLKKYAHKFSNKEKKIFKKHAKKTTVNSSQI